MTGAERAQTEPGQGFTAATDSDWLGPPVEAEAQASEASAEPARAKRPAPPRLLGALLILLALGWVAAVGWWLWQARPPLSLGNGIAWTATLAGPLALLALLWLMFGRTSRREAERFTRAVEQMTAESRALESVLEIVASRIEDNHSRLRGEAERLMSLGDEASDRLGRVTYYLSKETATLDQKAAALDSAANAAKVDIGVLLHDLPRAEAQARAVADAMKEAGLNAHGQASALEAQLGALAARGRDADEVLGGAAQRMSAHVARIESGSAAAAASMDESSAKMTGAVDGAMSRAAEAVETARAALELQGQTTLAAIEQSRAALDRAGEDSARSLAQRLETISGKIEAMAGHIAAQDAASHALVTGLGRELAELDSWFERLGQSGGAQSERLGQSVATVRAAAGELLRELGAGQAQASELNERAGHLGTALAGISSELREDLPAALGNFEAQAERAREAAQAIGPVVGEVEKSAEAAAARLAESEAAVERQHGAVETLFGRIAEGTAGAEEQLRILGAAAEEARAAGQNIVADTGASVADVRTAAAALLDELGAGRRHAGELIESAGSLGTALTGISAELRDELPGALRNIEEQSRRTREAAAAIAPVVGEVEKSARAAASSLGESGDAVGRQREAVETLLARIADGTAGAEEQLRSLGAAGQSIAADTGASVGSVRTAAAALLDELGAGQRQASELIQSAGSLGTALTGISSELRDELPGALRNIEEQAGRTREAAAAIAPIVGEVERSADAAMARLGEGEAAVGRQREALDALLARIGEGSASAEEQLRALGAAADDAHATAQRIVADTGPELIEALLRVREAAGQASERAREAISAAIPASAASLAEASRAALEQAVSETVERQMAELSAVSERAIETARRASERLTRQMLSLGETAAAIEARIDDERREREEKESENFSRRVALLIESLNSTAIDVTKILSNEVTDSAWTAYLKGDRGVFTRRAVRLLDRNDAREIARHYEEEPEFREQVNRYIHDFEAMLRRILADRDGSPLGVTILSSDMGKLYVALAQAIERIRS
jgi:ABC-type transporter Mla subunit MlaD